MTLHLASLSHSFSFFLLFSFLKSHSWFVDLVVATDDEKIAECCQGFGANVIMTSESCRNGRLIVFFFFFSLSKFILSMDSSSV